jgi:putative endonuclease
MHYVYLLRSESRPEQTYIGLTQDLRARLNQHNSGKSIHTNKFAPWRIVAYVGFADEKRAAAFERYLKSGSGRAFASRHLWDRPAVQATRRKPC